MNTLSLRSPFLVSSFMVLTSSAGFAASATSSRDNTSSKSVSHRFVPSAPAALTDGDLGKLASVPAQNTDLAAPDLFMRASKDLEQEIKRENVDLSKLSLLRTQLPWEIYEGIANALLKAGKACPEGKKLSTQLLQHLTGEAAREAAATAPVDLYS